MTVEEVLRHLEEERWDVDSLAAQLTDAQLRGLSASDRVRLIDYISGGHLVGNEDEQTIVRLLATTPAEQAGSVRDQLDTALLQQLDAAIDFDEYRDYHELQTAVDVGLLLAGGAGLIGASTRLARAIAAFDVAMGAADLVIRDFRHRIAQSDEGRDFLAAWDIVSTLVAAYGIGRAVVEAPQAIARLRRAWRQLRGTGATGELNHLDDQVDEVLDAADEVDDAARQSARDQDAPPGQNGDADAGDADAPEGGARARDGGDQGDRATGSRDAEGTDTSSPLHRTQWNNRSADELLDASEGRLGLPNSRGRQFPGHAGDHIPPERATRAEVMAHAQRRPNKQNTTVYYSRRHAIQDLRDSLGVHADEIARLAPGQSLSFTHQVPLRTGFNSQRGQPPTEASWDSVTVALERLMDGELHLVHFSPRLAR